MRSFRLFSLDWSGFLAFVDRRSRASNWLPWSSAWQPWSFSVVRWFSANKKNGPTSKRSITHLSHSGPSVNDRFRSREVSCPAFALGFGDFVPLANVQRSGRSLYSRWGYFIFTISFILFGLAIMASSLNLLVLRLAQFHSENGTGGISALLGRNEEDLIAAAIAHHRASIHIQQHNRICSNSTSLSPEQKLTQSYVPIRTYSWCSASSSSTSPSNSKFDVTRNSHERTCCAAFSLSGSQKRRRRHWHLRRSPQNIKHLLYFDHLLENHKLTSLRKSAMPSHYHQENHHGNHQAGMMNSSRQQRISIWANYARKKRRQLTFASVNTRK